MSHCVAITRPVSASLAQCELSHIDRTPIDVPRARAQHASYIDALRAAGCDIVALPSADDLPDAVFVEDTAVALDEVAILTHPGAESRRAELHDVAAALQRYRPVMPILPPATLDGGDVLRVGRTLYVGLSARTNAAAIDQLRARLEPFEYEVVPVRVTGCLHLKTAVTAVAEDTLIVNRSWFDTGPLAQHELIDVAPAEPFAANALRVGAGVIAAAAFPRTNERLVARGIELTVVDVSELARAEGGLTCCSILLRV